MRQATVAFLAAAASGCGPTMMGLGGGSGESSESGSTRASAESTVTTGMLKGSSGRATAESEAGTTSVGTAEGSTGSSSGVATTGGDSTAGPELPPVLGEWPFDGSAADVGGNGYDGQLLGPVAYVPSPWGEAVLFNGVQGYVDLSAAGGAFRASLSEMTISLRVQSSAWGALPKSLIFLGIVNSEDPAENAFAFRVESAVAQVFTEEGPGTNHIENLGEAPAENSWARMTLVLQGGAVRYFVGETFVGETAYTEAMTSSSTLTMGGTDQNTQTLVGMIDHLTIYEGALSEQQVQWLASQD